MFRIYCLQNWFNLSDRQMEGALYEIESMRRFAGFGGVTGALPDETTILNFRHLLERHESTVVLLEAVNAHLKAREVVGFQRRHGERHTHSCAKSDRAIFINKKDRSIKLIECVLRIYSDCLDFLFLPFLTASFHVYIFYFQITYSITTPSSIDRMRRLGNRRCRCHYRCDGSQGHC